MLSYYLVKLSFPSFFYEAFWKGFQVSKAKRYLRVSPSGENFHNFQERSWWLFQENEGIPEHNRIAVPFLMIDLCCSFVCVCSSRK